MVKKTPLKKIQKIVRDYSRLLKIDGIPIEKIILYGSYAKGTPKKDSDIDICVLSKKFGINPRKEGQYLFKKLWQMENANIEPVGYSPKDFYGAKNKSPLINEIQKHGIEINV
ncbi:MAG: nucleotidyltransferase domain-containing protein [Patescibacteria group bacterium]